MRPTACSHSRCRPTRRAHTLIVERRDSETAERLLGRFQQMIQRAGILRDAKRRRHFISKSEARRIARARTARRARRSAEKALLRNRTNGRRR